MSWLYSNIDIRFAVYTKDNKQFRYCCLQYKVKRNWAWLWSKLFGSDGLFLDKVIIDCVQELFLIWINQVWMYEGEDINRCIREDRLKLVNNHINSLWKNDYSEIVDFKVKDIKITHLIR